MSTKAEIDAATREAKEIATYRKQFLKGKFNSIGMWFVYNDFSSYDVGDPSPTLVDGYYFDVVEYVLAGKFPGIERGIAIIEPANIIKVPKDFHVGVQDLAKEREELIERVKQIDKSLKAKK